MKKITTKRIKLLLDSIVVSLAFCAVAIMIIEVAPPERTDGRGRTFKATSDGIVTHFSHQ